jgi:hypothetical protein
MNWPQIAACLRNHLREVSSEAQGSLHGQWWDRPGAPLYGFHAQTERGGTKLVLTVEVGDFEELDGKVGEAVKKGLPNVTLVGRIVMMKAVVDVMSATSAKVDEAARALVGRAEKMRQGTLPA